MGIRLFSSMCLFMSLKKKARLHVEYQKKKLKQKGQSRIPNNSNKTTKEQTVEIKQHLSKKCEDTENTKRVIRSRKLKKDRRLHRWPNETDKNKI